MNPKAINKNDWEKMKRKYLELNLSSWGYLDGVKKMSILRGAKININAFAIFGDEYILKYPKDIYMNNKKIILNPTTLNSIRRMALNERKEVGGIINNNKIDILFSGNENRIRLDVKNKAQTLFHTHPEDEDVNIDPPSVLDIVSFLALNVQSIAEFILNNENEKGKKDVKNMLKIQNSAVFTKNEVYVYYISSPLILEISKYLMNVYKNKDDFIYEVEKLLETVELYYSYILLPFNMTLDEKRLKEYLTKLSSLGVIVKRFKYTDFPEVYVSHQ